MGNLTPDEELRLWQGFSLWHEHIESGDDVDDDPGKGMTQGDRAAFDEFMDEKERGSDG